MQHLILLRHATTKPDSLDDFNRELTEHGKKQAQAIAEYFLQHQGLLPDLVLCSTAQRTRQTIEPLLEKLAIKTQYLDELYNPSIDQIKVLINECAGAERLMIVSHNPAISRLSSILIDKGAFSLEPSQMVIFKIDNHENKEMILFYESI